MRKQPRTCLARLKLALMAAALMVPPVSFAQDWESSPSLPRDQFRSGETVLRAFAPVAEATRHSIVKFNVDGETVALGAVVASNGLVLTKASELKEGRLTCWLATEEEVSAEVLGVDEEEDVALVRVHASGLKPIQWASGNVSIGQWAITPGIAETPHAVGIISALPRKIRPRRAFIGVRFDFGSSVPKIETLLTGFGAEKAGLKPGDVILAVNGDSVTNREQIVDGISDFRAGETVSLRVQRGTKEFQVTVKLMAPDSRLLRRGRFPDESEAALGGETSRRALGFDQAIEHDTVLKPWLCGGPLVNLDGKAIGLNIARASRVTTYALSARLVQQILHELLHKQPSTGTGLKG